MIEDLVKKFQEVWDAGLGEAERHVTTKAFQSQGSIAGSRIHGNDEMCRVDVTLSDEHDRHIIEFRGEHHGYDDQGNLIVKFTSTDTLTPSGALDNEPDILGRLDRMKQAIEATPDKTTLLESAHFQTRMKTRASGAVGQIGDWASRAVRGEREIG